MKNILKEFILSLLHSVRWVIKKLYIHIIPSDIVRTKKHEINCYDLYHEEELKKCFEHFKKYYLKAVHLSGDDILNYAIHRAIKNNDGLYLEFGVWEGRTINIFSRHLKNKKIFGFDTFKGINEDWAGTDKAKGFYSANNKMPKVNDNCILIKGLIQDTLPEFLIENSLKYKDTKIAFVHMDVNTYESSKFILELIKPRLHENAIILLRGCHNYPGWSVGEYKALQETFSSKEYKFLAFSMDGSPAVIQFLKTL